MKTSVGPFSATLRKSIRLRSRGPYRRSRWPAYRARISVDRRSQPATMSALPATATPLLRPRSRSSWLIVRQSGAPNGVVMFCPISAHSSCAFPLCRKMFYRTRQSAIEKRNERGTQVASDQGLIRATACAFIEKLNSGEVTPLNLHDLLEQRIDDVYGKLNTLPMLCCTTARTLARTCLENPTRIH